MEGKVLVAKSRETKGKNSNKRLRRDGIIPAIMYSHGAAESIQVLEKDFFKLFKGHVSESVIFDLKVEGSSDDQMAFVKDYKADPVTDQILHIDFFKVTKGEKINTTVPVELDGSPVGIKLGGILNISDRQIEVECMPKDLPEKIHLDIAYMEVGDIVHAKDLALPEDVELYSNHDAVIVSVDTPRVVEEETEDGELDASAENVPTVEASTDE
jgi:large subunit ribosomal protein L25